MQERIVSWSEPDILANGVSVINSESMTGEVEDWSVSGSIDQIAPRVFFTVAVVARRFGLHLDVRRTMRDN